MAYIEFKNVSKGFGSGTARSEVLDDINLSVEEGEFIAILGYSGVGKSTLMNLVAGLIAPDEGEILVGGKKVDGPSPDRGLVFQNYSLLPWLNVQRNVGVAVDEVYKGEESSAKKNRILEAVGKVNLTDALHKKPGELSGGMRQRNSVARTLSTNPKVLLLDEPLSALDALTRSVIQDQILEIWKAQKQTVLLITNDVDEGLYMADRIIPLSIGPAATLGPELAVDAERPRDRMKINLDPGFQAKRTKIIQYLLAEKAKERERQSAEVLTLPNIRPLDISRHKPSWFFGLRPRPKRTIATS